MVTRRQFLGLAAGATTAGLLPGCSSVLPEPDVQAAGFGQQATGTVQVWCRSATQTGLTDLVKKFNASQDRLTVELTPVLDAQYVTKLATAIRGRSVPDLVDIDDINSMLFIYRDAFTDLTEPLAALDFRDKLSPGHLRLATKDGRVYGVPYLADNSMFWFNTELCDRADVDPDEAVKSFDNLLDAARKLRKLGDDIYAWTFPANSPGALGFVVQPMVWAADTDLIQGTIGSQSGHIVGNDVVQRMLELHRQLWVDGLVPRANFSDDASRWGSDFRAGKIGIFPSNYSVVVSASDDAFHQKVTPRLLSGPDGGAAFAKSVLYTLLYTVIVTGPILVLGYALAVLVRRKRRGSTLLRTVFFLPFVVGLSTLSFVTVLEAQPESGVINVVLKRLGITDGTTAWLVDGPLATGLICVLVIWAVSGLTMMLLMAGMQAIPREYYESAELDGAGWWKTEREITIPILRRTIAMAVIISVIGSLLAFSQFYILTRGGPGTDTTTVVQYIYNRAFVQLQLGAATALSIVLVIVVGLVTAAQFRLLREKD